MGLSMSLINENEEEFIECFTFFETLGKMRRYVAMDGIELRRIEVIDVNPKYYAVPFPRRDINTDTIWTLNHFLKSFAYDSASSNIAALSTDIDDTIITTSAWADWDPSIFITQKGLKDAVDELPQKILQYWSYVPGEPQGRHSWEYAFLIDWLSNNMTTDEQNVQKIKRRIDAMAKPEFNDYKNKSNAILKGAVHNLDIPFVVDTDRVNELYLNMLRH